jgi:Protein of unknown function (DUF4038)/Domain of unknown function (DUF5060)/Putative collagen-binding domain of a collagenase
MTRHPSSFLARAILLTALLAVFASGAFAQVTLPACSGSMARYSVCEIVLNTSGSYTNDYTTASVTATFTLSGGGITKTVSGFWDGDLVDGRGTFRIRFNASNAGSWSYTTSSTDMGLNGKSGSFTVTSGGARGFVRRNSGNPEKFVFDNGTRYFMWGQTYYQIVANARAGGGWQTSIDNSAGYSMNKVRLLIFPFGSFAPYSSGSSPFLANHNNPDLTHWQKLDEVVNYLNQKPMVADVILFNDHPEAFGTTTQDQRYVRYAMARLAAFPNVIWCLSNEWDSTGLGAPHATDPSYWNTIGGIVRNEDPWMDQGGNQRPLSIHQKTEDLFQFFASSWPTHAILQYGTHQSAHPLSDDWANYSIRNNLGNGMPVVNDEYGYMGACDTTPCPQTGHVFDQTAHRQAIWGIAVAGGYGSAGDLRTINGGQPSISADWKDEPEYGDISRLVDFFTNKVSTWWQMSTQNSLVTSGTRVYVTGQTSVQYVTYAAVGGAFTLNLPAPSGTSYGLYRYNPRTGGTPTFIRNVGSGSQTFTVPGDVPDSTNDWVLQLKAQ